MHAYRRARDVETARPSTDTNRTKQQPAHTASNMTTNLVHITPCLKTEYTNCEQCVISRFYADRSMCCRMRRSLPNATMLADLFIVRRPDGQIVRIRHGLPKQAN